MSSPRDQTLTGATTSCGLSCIILFKGPRPFIESAPKAIQYGQTIELHTPQAEHIHWQLIRPMATTHSVDTEQRLVDLPIARRSFCKLEVHVPREHNLAPPGWYMLFITDREGVPSTARWIHLSSPVPQHALAASHGARFEAKRLTVKTEGLKIKRTPEE